MNEFDVTYWFYNDNAPLIEKKVRLDYDIIKKNVLLNLYYADIVKIKEYTKDVLQYIGSQLWFSCCAIEKAYLASHIFVPNYEVMHILAKIYSEEMLVTEEENGLCVVKLSQKGC